MSLSDEAFVASYRDIEKRMEAQAASDGDVYLPNPAPTGPVHHILICMEPSLGRWARTPEEATSKIKAGFRNFLTSVEDFILHYSVRRYLCEPGERYHITDLSKGAMLVEHAEVDRQQRYDRWYGLLLEEVDLVAVPDSTVFAVGRAVEQHLLGRGFPRPLNRIIHYSGQAASARNEGVVGREADYDRFRESVSMNSLIEAAEAVLRDSSVPENMVQDTLRRLRGSELTESRRKLIFNYKVAFEDARAS